jgi:hypothetical protein
MGGTPSFFQKAGGLGVAAVVGEQRVVLDTHRAVPFDDREAVSGA